MSCPKFRINMQMKSKTITKILNLVVSFMKNHDALFSAVTPRQIRAPELNHTITSVHVFYPIAQTAGYAVSHLGSFQYPFVITYDKRAHTSIRPSIHPQSPEVAKIYPLKSKTRRAKNASHNSHNNHETQRHRDFRLSS